MEKDRKQHFYNLLISINFNCKDAINPTENANDSEQKLEDVIVILENCLRQILSTDESIMTNQACPPPTVWDPITRTCV